MIDDTSHSHMLQDPAPGRQRWWVWGDPLEQPWSPPGANAVLARMGQCAGDRVAQQPADSALQ